MTCQLGQSDFCFAQAFQHPYFSRQRFFVDPWPIPASETRLFFESIEVDKSIVCLRYILWTVPSGTLALKKAFAFARAISSAAALPFWFLVPHDTPILAANWTRSRTLEASS
jgi:hypothetical protein